MFRFTPIGVVAAVALAVGLLGLGFQGVTVATDVFNDVPNGAFYHDDVNTIEALNITNGCDASPPLYCPTNKVSRGEMGSFLARTAGLYRAAYDQSANPIQNLGGELTPILGDSFSAPADCVLLMSATLNWDDDSSDSQLWLQWFVDNESAGPIFFRDGGGAGENRGHSAIAFKEVTTGDHIVQLRALAAGGGTADIWSSGFFALCVPFDAGGDLVTAP